MKAVAGPEGVISCHICNNSGMSLEWVAPTATAFVGLAGIAATWLTSRAGRADQREMVRIQHEHASETAIRDMRRDVYAAFAASAYEAIHVMMLESGFDTDEFVVASQKITLRLAEVRIVGSDLVRQAADNVASAILRLQGGCLEKGKGDPEVKELNDTVNDLLYILERLMASDLGIDPYVSVEESNRNVSTLKYAMDMIQYKKSGGSSRDPRSDAPGPENS